MSQGAFVTLVGYVAQEPNIRTTKTGKTVTDLRVGITPRYRDQATGEWRDAESSYFTVSCWDRLAHHVRASMHKGEPVLVRGKFKTSSYEDRDGRPRTETRITADTVGHDLSRGIANYIRHRSKQPPAEGDMPGDPTAEQVPGNLELAGGPDELLDEEAIERFGRDLDDADLATRALAEDVEGAEDSEDEDVEEEEDDMAASAVPATPY
ncbi:MAG TPA: single-stranded DNA-binding protein [Streptosporangiaceae bacterium]|nr:single-stranded DNA-binding protein [Streptosporangiaceae bacterium]